MWGGFQKVIKEVFPNALIVIDRFQGLNLVNKALKRIRWLLDLKGLKSGCDRPVGFLRRPYGSRFAHARAPSNPYLLS